MSPTKVLRKFTCSITELYAVCRLCWNSCLENIADFTGYKTFYDAAYVAIAQAEIDAASAMPGEEQRDLVHETYHVQLEQTGDECLSKFRALRGYIKSSFATPLVKMNIDAAGGNYYTTAYNGDWEDLQQMMADGSAYITANNAVLTAGGMPAAFPAAYDAAYTTFLPIFNSFKDAQQDAEEGTAARLAANNAIYDRVIAMNADGQIIYENDQAKFDRFVFARVLDLVTPKSPGLPATSIEIKGKITSVETGNGIGNAQVKIYLPENPGDPATTQTDITGHYSFLIEELPAGAEWLIHHQVTAPGFFQSDQNLEVVIGTSYTVSVSLVPDMPPVPPVPPVPPA